MPKPWEKYSAKPWEKYGGKAQEETPVEAPQISSVEQAYKQPYQTIVKRTGLSNVPILGTIAQGVARAIDIPAGAVGGAAYEGGKNLNRGITNLLQGNYETGTEQIATAPINLAGGAFGLTPQGVGFNLLTGGAQQVPAVKEVVGSVLSPSGRAFNPQTEQGQARTGLIDAAIQLALLRKSGEIGSGIKGGYQNFREQQAAKSYTKQTQKAQADIKKVAPPTPKELNYDKLLNQATPYIAKQLKETPITSRSEVSPIRQATDVVAQAKANLWNEKIAPVVEQYGTQTIDGTQIANSIREGLTDYTKNHDPLAAKRIESYAASFEGKQIPISQASQYITELNARTSAYQKAPAIQKTLIENASPNILSEVSAVDALREQVYSKLDELGAPEIRGLKKDYGALMQVHKALERNIVRHERGTQSASFYTTPWGQTVKTGVTLEGVVHSPKVTAVALTTGLIKRYLTERNKPNPTIERAFNRLEKSKESQSNINIEDFPVNPEFYAEANRLGVRIDKSQDVKGGKSMPLFTDNKTGSTFTIQKGETLADAVNRVRKANSQPKMTWQEALAQQQKTKK